MQSIALATAGAIVTLAVGGSATLAVESSVYAKADCEAADLKSQEYLRVGKCLEHDGGISKMFECSGTVATMKMYNDSACAVADPAQDVVYSGAEVCESSDDTKWTKRTCVDLDLGEVQLYQDSACAVLVQDNLIRGASCSKHASFSENAWQAKSTNIVLSSDALSVTVSNHDTMDCSGDVDGNTTTGICGGTCNPLEEDGQISAWFVVNYFPGCGPVAVLSGAVARAPTLLLKAVALMGAKIAFM